LDCGDDRTRVAIGDATADRGVLRAVTGENRDGRGGLLHPGDVGKLDGVAERRGELEISHLVGTLHRVERENVVDLGGLAVDLDRAGTLFGDVATHGAGHHRRVQAVLARLGLVDVDHELLAGGAQVALHVDQSGLVGHRFLDHRRSRADVAHVLAGHDDLE